MDRRSFVKLLLGLFVSGAVLSGPQADTAEAAGKKTTLTRLKRRRKHRHRRHKRKKKT